MTNDLNDPWFVAFVASCVVGAIWIGLMIGSWLAGPVVNYLDDKINGFVDRRIPHPKD